MATACEQLRPWVRQSDAVGVAGYAIDTRGEGEAMWAVLSLWMSAWIACHPAQDCGVDVPAVGVVTSCRLADGRRYDVVPPADADALPTILAFHGGGGNASGGRSVTCPDGDPDDGDASDCLDGLGQDEGFLTVYPEGTSAKLLRNRRTWNAGGGVGAFQCVSGRACAEGVDDIAYVEAVLDDLDRWTSVDSRRIYATGLSNGGAMSYRVGRELSSRIAAIAPVGSGDQFGVATAAPPPERPVPVLHVHGTEDPCWSFEGGASACLQDDGRIKVGVAETMALLRAERGCADEVLTEAIADTEEDGTTSRIDRSVGCVSDVELVTIEGGGHTWPGGNAYLGERVVGRVARDFSANELMWEFFRAHPLPE